MSLDLLRNLLNSSALRDEWYRSYGLTKSRSNSIIKRQKDRNSFFNPQSETALTTFFLCNLDGWHQLQALSPKPRQSDSKSKWSEKFFRALRNPQQSVIQARPASPLWDKLWKEAFPNDTLPTTEGAILLLEFEVLNRAFHPDKNNTIKAFRHLSFLPIEKQKEWSQYDAVLIVPQADKGIFYFIEAKLHSDVSMGTERFPYVSQIVRNLEAAFFLTRHEESQYRGWDFRYLLICPRKSLQYKAAYYAYALGPQGHEVGETLKNYELLLSEEIPGWKNNQTTKDRFAKFRADTPRRVSVVSWCRLAALLTERVADFFTKYRSQLKDCADIDDSEEAKVWERFQAAGIPA
jgi:hypothetical protein